jgi:hypothetical protein
MGLLDNKSRVIDLILTEEGKKQLAQNQIRLKYVVFTDDATHYSQEIVSGSSVSCDHTNRVYLEACSLPQDTVTLEANDAGRLNSFKNVAGIVVRDGRILNTSFASGSLISDSGSLITNSVLSGQPFTSQVLELLATSAQHFKNQRFLSTSQKLFDSDQFICSEDSLTFEIKKDRPFNENMRPVNRLRHLEGLIQDVRLSSQANFAYLPPINKNKDKLDVTTGDIPKQLLLGSYKRWTTRDKLTLETVDKELAQYKSLGMSKSIRFNPTSKDNTLFLQMYEMNNNQIVKLDVIDFGKKHLTRRRRRPAGLSGLQSSQVKFDGPTNSFSPEWLHVFFVGKVLTDDVGADTFVHLFTLVFGQ